MPDREEVFEAIRRSWSIETSCAPDEWTPENPSKGQCDASAFVAWEYLGGDLVLGQVLVDAKQTEHHYWNRIDGVDFDLTRDQFMNGEDVVEMAVVEDEFIRTKQETMRPELKERIKVMRRSVGEKLGP